MIYWSLKNLKLSLIQESWFNSLEVLEVNSFSETVVVSFYCLVKPKYLQNF